MGVRGFTNARDLALNKFQGLSIEDSMLLLPPKDGGINLVANVTLPNPSVMKLEIVCEILRPPCPVLLG